MPLLRKEMESIILAHGGEFKEIVITHEILN